MSTEKLEKWIAYKPEGSKGWWCVRRGGEASYSFPDPVFHGEDAEQEAKKHADLWNMADGMGERMKRLESARAFIAASALHAHGDSRIKSICDQILNALSEEAPQ